MIDYGTVRSFNRPKELEITANAVFVASNIQEYTQEFDGFIMNGYEYNYASYDKDEYITLLTQSNIQAINELSDELEAAKILLGVE